MQFKIVSDSAADLLSLSDVPYASAAMHVIVDGRDFADNAAVDLAAMDAALRGSKRSSTACPGLGAWLDAFGDAETVFCVTMTSALSGSHAAALLAKEDYEQRHPGRTVYVIDSLSAGPELLLLIERLRTLLLSGLSGEEVYREILAYHKRTKLFFSLESLSNLAKNGRVSPLVAKLTGILGIRLIGEASEKGELHPLDKCRGEQKALAAIWEHMRACGFSGGRVSIGHNNNRTAAEALRRLILKEMPHAQIDIHPLRALCSYYAERGGLLVGVETGCR